jgi:hypothetical protein
MKQNIITDVTKRCFLCGQDSAHRKVEASNDVYLDFLPKKDTIAFVAQQYELCPHCGYVMDNIERIPSLDERLTTTKARNTEDYMKIFQSLIDTDEKMLMLEHIREERYNYVDGVKFALAVYYEYKNDAFKHKKYLNEHIRVIEKRISVQRAKMGMIQQDAFLMIAVKDYYMLVECCRRAGQFEKALTNIEKFSKLKYTKETKMYKSLFDTQKKLCKKQIAERR